MVAVTAGAYQAWITTLTGSDLKMALAAGLDKPPVDTLTHSAVEIRDYDGLAVFHKNGAAHPLEHESSPIKEVRAERDLEDLSNALRKVFEFIVRNMSPAEILARESTLACRVFMVCRALQLNGCETPPLSQVASKAHVTRAALSKIGVELRDALKCKNFQFGGREKTRKTMRNATKESWKRRKG